MVSTIEMHNKLYSDRMLVRLLISIDRSKSVKENEETLELAINVRTRSNALVGIDFSGNPLKGSFVSFIPLLQRCRNMGMFITVHTAEVPDKESRSEVQDHPEIFQNKSLSEFFESLVGLKREEMPLMTETDRILFFW